MINIWGSTQRKRLLIFAPIAMIWVSAFIWLYTSDHSYQATFTLLSMTLLYMLFGIYVLIDNIRSSNIEYIIKSSENEFNRIASLFKYEFNDIVCRLHIAGMIKIHLEKISSRSYNYIVTDITTAKDAENQLVIYEICADNKYRYKCIIKNSSSVLV